MCVYIVEMLGIFQITDVILCTHDPWDTGLNTFAILLMSLVHKVQCCKQQLNIHKKYV